MSVDHSRVQFRILGPLEVWRDGRVIPITAPRQRSLLAVLLLNANRVLGRDELIERLWEGHAPRTARAALQNAVSELRRILGTGILESAPPGYRLNVRMEDLDSLRFQTLVDEARDAEPEIRAMRLRDALAQWRGPPLSEYPFVENELVRLEELRLIALEQRIDADLALGHEAHLVPELESLVASMPLRERLWEQLVLALYRCGRQADALDAYRRAHEVLINELGIEPGPALKELQRAVLMQDPRLDTATAADPLLERAAPLLPISDAGRAQSLYELAVALRRLGEAGRAVAMLAQAGDHARRAGDRSLVELARLTQSQYETWSGRRTVREHLLQADRSLAAFEQLGDDANRGKALLARGLALGELGSAAAGDADIRRAIELARLTGDRWQEGWSRNMLAFFLWVKGPIPVEDAIRGCAEHLAALEWGPPGPIGLWATLGYLHAQAGRAAEAASWGQRAVDSAREAGLRGELAEIRHRFAATLELNGDHARAEVELRSAHDLLASVAPVRPDPVLLEGRARAACVRARRVLSRRDARCRSTTERNRQHRESDPVAAGHSARRGPERSRGTRG